MLELLASSLELSVESVEIFALVLVRVGTLVFLLPFMGIQGTTPNTVRAGLAFFISILVFPQLATVSFAVQGSVPFFFILVIEQVLVGVLIGFTTTYLFHFVTIGGHLIARDIGIAMGGTVDPIQEETADEVAVLILLVLSIVFLVRGNHYYFVKVIFDSFVDIPLGQFSWNWKPVAQILTLMSASAIITGVKLAGPLIVTLLVTSLAMALVARVMPQMNVWIVSVPIKVVLGVLVIWQIFPLMAQLFEANFKDVQDGIRLLMQVGGPGG